MKTTLEKCPDCGILVDPNRMNRHWRRSHSPSAILRKQQKEEAKKKRESDIGKCSECGLEMPRYRLKGHLKSKHNIDGVFRLISRRGTRVESLQKCYVCKSEKGGTWRYAQSTKGEVHICLACKPRVFDKSFGKIDALSRSVTGGGFETNRRKH